MEDSANNRGCSDTTSPAGKAAVQVNGFPQQAYGDNMHSTANSDSSLTMAVQMLPQDANPYGSIHGGIIMKHIDTAAGIVAIRHVRGNAVTASIDRLDFHHPAYVGDLLMLKAAVNLVGRTSIEVGVRVEAENLLTGEIRHTASAYLTFVALDKKGRPTPARPYRPSTPDEVHRFEEAKIRRETRLAEKSREKAREGEIRSTPG